MMITTAQRTMYHAFGLRIDSDFPLPELLAAEDPLGEADVEIRYGDLSEDWREFGNYNGYYAFPDNRVLLYVPETAIYCIKGGNGITVSPLDGAAANRVRLYVLGTCMGALLLQRNTLPLHGSAVLINGKAYAITGESGAGKSTLAAALLQRGYPLVSDDLIAVTLTGQACSPVITPAYPQQKLWQESMERLGVPSEPCYQLYDTKYAVPVTARFCSEKVPLGGVFELEKSGRDAVEVRSVDGLERLHVLQCHTYRNFLIPPMGLAQWHLTTAAGMAGSTPMFQLQRPVEGFTVDELAEHLLERI